MKQCKVEACVRRPIGNYCSMHRNRIYKEGNVGETGSRRIRPLKSKNKQGYWLIFKPNHCMAYKHGYVLEHRYLMSEHLGRPLLRQEHVHHIDGDRLNNNLSNLELWSTHQPSGQRIPDKIQYAIEILQLYAPDKLNNQGITNGN